MGCFVSEVLALVRSHVSAAGGNALTSLFFSECLLYQHKNQVKLMGKISICAFNSFIQLVNGNRIIIRICHYISDYFNDQWFQKFYFLWGFGTNNLRRLSIKIKQDFIDLNRSSLPEHTPKNVNRIHKKKIITSHQ